MANKEVFYSYASTEGHTYFFYTDGTYRCSHWIDDRELQNGARWRVTSDNRLQFWLDTNESWFDWGWGSTKSEEDKENAKKFIEYCLHGCMLGQEE